MKKRCVCCGQIFIPEKNHIGEKICIDCRSEMENEIFIEAILEPKKFKDRLKFLDEVFEAA